MNLRLMKGISAHECLSSTYVNAGFCDFYSCFADLYFHILLKIKRPSAHNFGEFTDDLL